MVIYLVEFVVFTGIEPEEKKAKSDDAEDEADAQHSTQPVTPVKDDANDDVWYNYLFDDLDDYCYDRHCLHDHDPCIFDVMIKLI